MRGRRINLRAVRSSQSQYGTAVLDYGYLHSQANTEERNGLFTGITDCGDLSFDPPVSEAAGNKNPADSAKQFAHILICNLFSIDPADLHFRVGCKTCMRERLHYA
ncbi:hypothetical protein D3C81_1897440 [compost metagenome]